MTNILGLETFLDSFQHPLSYQYLKNDRINGVEQKTEYLIFTTWTSQKNPIVKGDVILYRNTAHTIVCGTVFSVQTQHGDQTYFTTFPNDEKLDGPIYNYQILGKTIGVIEDNLWNALSVHLWVMAIENLNAITFFSS